MKFKLKLLLLLFILTLVPTLSISANETRIYDGDDLISSEIEQELEEQLAYIYETYQLDVYIVTTFSLEGEAASTYAENMYYYYDFGYGNNKDGLLLLLSLEYRDWAITTEGFGDVAYNNYALDQFEENILHYFSDGEYEKGFSEYVDMVEAYAKQARTGDEYDYSNQYRGTMYYVIGFGIVMLVGIFAAVGYVVYLFTQMNNVVAQKEAKAYIDKDSFLLHDKSDQFLYSTVTKVIRPKSNSSGSSGSSGGRSGKF